MYVIHLFFSLVKGIMQYNASHRTEVAYTRQALEYCLHTDVIYTYVYIYIKN